MAHYPGPWRVHGEFDPDISVEVMSGDPKDEALMVCEVEPFTGEWFADEISNVRLISAAPELLEACIAARNEFAECSRDCMGTPNFESFRLLADKMDVAIAKSEGRT